MMNRKTRANIIGFAAFAIVIGLVTYLPGLRTGSETTAGAATDGPQLVGQMKYFVLAKRALSRPDIAWQDANGKEVSLADFDGKVVLLNYWASWCAPCQRELPGVDRLQAKMASPNFTVVALNVDAGGKEVAERNAKRLNLRNLKLYLDPESKTSTKLGLSAMPTTYLFDRRGNLLGLFRGGAEWDSDEAVALINYFIERPNYVDGLKQVERGSTRKGTTG